MDRTDDDLLDASEIAARLGLKDSREVLNLRLHRLGFPAPVARRQRALVWSWSSVETWAMTNAGAVAGTLGITLASFMDQYN